MCSCRPRCVSTGTIATPLRAFAGRYCQARTTPQRHRFSYPLRPAAPAPPPPGPPSRGRPRPHRPAQFPRRQGAGAELRVAPLAVEILGRERSKPLWPQYLDDASWAPALASWARAEAVCDLLTEFLSTLDIRSALSDVITTSETEEALGGPRNGGRRPGEWSRRWRCCASTSRSPRITGTCWGWTRWAEPGWVRASRRRRAWIWRSIGRPVTTKVSPVQAARDDLGVFAELIGLPMEPWQLAEMRSPTWQTILISPRQCGKSRSLSLLAVWTAFRQPKQMILVVSAAPGMTHNPVVEPRTAAGMTVLSAASAPPAISAGELRPERPGHRGTPRRLARWAFGRLLVRPADHHPVAAGPPHPMHTGRRQQARGPMGPSQWLNTALPCPEPCAATSTRGSARDRAGTHRSSSATAAATGSSPRWTSSGCSTGARNTTDSASPSPSLTPPRNLPARGISVSLPVLDELARHAPADVQLDYRIHRAVTTPPASARRACFHRRTPCSHTTAVAVAAGTSGLRTRCPLVPLRQRSSAGGSRKEPLNSPSRDGRCPHPRRRHHPRRRCLRCDHCRLPCHQAECPARRCSPPRCDLEFVLRDQARHTAIA